MAPEGSGGWCVREKCAAPPRDEKCGGGEGNLSYSVEEVEGVGEGNDIGCWGVSIIVDGDLASETGSSDVRVGIDGYGYTRMSLGGGEKGESGKGERRVRWKGSYVHAVLGGDGEEVHSGSEGEG